MRYDKKLEGEVSNFVSSEAFIVQFTQEATLCALKLKHKYYQVFNVMEVDDVVSECWKKVLSSNISYDPSKGAAFKSFVCTIVNSKLIDLTRELNRGKRIPVVWSMDAGADNSHGDSDGTTRFDLIPDNSFEDLVKTNALLEDLKSYTKLFNTVPELRQIILLYLKGYTPKEVSEMTGVSVPKIRKIMRILRDIMRHRRDGSEKTIGDIIYFESQEWEDDCERKDFILGVSSMIIDTKTNIKLYDVVKGVINGWSYNKISAKLKVMPDDIVSVLYRYESIAI